MVNVESLKPCCAAFIEERASDLALKPRWDMDTSTWVFMIELGPQK